MLGTLDLDVIGLTFGVVGLFFLANSLQFKRIRRVLHEYFGVEKMLPLKEIRTHMVRKVQIYLGFLFLFLGYGVQIAAKIEKNINDSKETSLFQPDLLTVAGIMLVSIVTITVLLKIIQVVWTRVTFKRLLIDFFRDHEWELVRNIDIAKELGFLLKIPFHKDDSIEEYVGKIKKALHIPTTTNGAAQQRQEKKAALPPKATSSQAVHRATPPRIE